MSNHLPTKRKCAFIDGCNEMVASTTFYRHKGTECCKKRRQNNADAGQLADPYEANADDNVSMLRVIFLAGMLILQKMAGISDRAITLLIKFNTAFLHLLGDILQIDVLSKLADSIPLSYQTFKKTLDVDECDFVEYAVCPKCHSIFPKADVISGRVSKCNFVRWPRHTQSRMRRPCNTQLHRGSTTTPKSIYCYKPVTSYLRDYVRQPNFLQFCNMWRERKIRRDYFVDVYDGKLWASEKNNYLINPTNLYGMINVDWFQPYKHTPYSIGAIYMVILNLPRSIRFKEENVLLLGVIPGPTEPSLHLNNYLKPLVDELLELDKGVHFEDTSPTGNYYRFRLFGCSSDLPATRKLGGFLSYSAKYGCSKCLKEFPRINTGEAKLKGNYSGFDRDNWNLRTSIDHKADATAAKMARTIAERKTLEGTGARWSDIFRLDYFNPISGHTIDPMHCLLLGISKTMTKKYLKSGLIDKAGTSKIQMLIDNIRVPTTVGRIPRKIASGFASFTADQWKNWTLIYSSITLKFVLEDRHYKVWMKFVHASSLMLRKILSHDDLVLADGLLMSFARDVQNLYGPQFVTPNFHMACHMSAVIRDYGPVYSFWCYSFERYNGILGDYSLNNRNITVQMMRKFLLGHQLSKLTLPEVTSDAIKSILTSDSVGKRGTISSVGNDISDHAVIALGNTIEPNHISFSLEDMPPYIQIDKKTQRHLSNTEYQRLLELYATIFPPDKLPTLHRLIDTMNSVIYCNEVFQIDNSDWVNCNIVRARWLRAGHGTAISLTERVARAGMIKGIFLTHHTIENRQQSMLLFDVDWYSWHDQPYAFGQHVQLYHKTVCPPGPYSFVPIQRIISKCATMVQKYQHINVQLIIPLHGQWAL